MVRILVVITTSFVPYGGLASVMMNSIEQLIKQDSILTLRQQI